MNSNLSTKFVFFFKFNFQNEGLQVASKETCSNFKHIHESNSNERKKKIPSATITWYRYMWVGMRVCSFTEYKKLQNYGLHRKQNIVHCLNSPSKPDMFFPIVQSVTFWRATRFVFAKNWSKTQVK